MTLRSGDRKFSFDILASSEYDDVFTSISRSSSDPLHTNINNNGKSKRKKRNKRNKGGSSSSSKLIDPLSSITNDYDVSYSCTMTTVTEVKEEKGSESENCEVVSTRPVQFGELRQRNVSYTLLNESINETDVKGNDSVVSGGEERVNRDESGSDRKVNRDEPGSDRRVNRDETGLDRRVNRDEMVVMNGNGKVEEDVDWNKVMADDPKSTLSVVKSPMKYFMEEMYAGNSLRSTTTVGNDKERERVYDTIFRLPWRCELLIDVGFFVCLDSFLSLLTIMPTRIIISCWRLLKTRQLKRLSSEELSDFGSFIVLIAGVTLLQQANISLIYHMIRGQGTIKLYVVYNVLEIFDKLCQSFGGDIMQALFHSADGLANCSPENLQFWLWRFISDEALAVASSIIHSFILLAQAITLSTCIVAHNNALFAMLVSNNFSEIKGNVFKRYSKDNVQSLVYFDSIERFHISAFILFVLAQNMLESEGPWFESFLCNAMVVFMCEGMIDIIKHSFIAKFNDIKPIAFSEFLEDLCKQVLNTQTETNKKHLTFLPLAPACVVIRVFRPVYETHLPHNPFLWRLFWICVLFLMTFVMLASLKLLIGTALRKHAQWYVKRCEKRKLHSD